MGKYVSNSKQKMLSLRNMDPLVGFGFDEYLL